MKFLIIAAIVTIGIPYSLGACPVHPIKECTTPGPMCESCTSLTMCTETTPGVYNKTHLQDCVSPQKCLNSSCRVAPDPICDGADCLEFPCKSEGIFPDQFNCTKFVMCVNTAILPTVTLKPYIGVCERGFRYNAANGTCDLPSSTCRLPYPIDVCTAAGQAGPITDNHNFYSVCEEYSTSNKLLYPILRRCPGNEQYENFQCK